MKKIKNIQEIKFNKTICFVLVFSFCCFGFLFSYLIPYIEWEQSDFDNNTKCNDIRWHDNSYWLLSGNYLEGTETNYWFAKVLNNGEHDGEYFDTWDGSESYINPINNGVTNTLMGFALGVTISKFVDLNYTEPRFMISTSSWNGDYVNYFPFDALSECYDIVSDVESIVGIGYCYNSSEDRNELAFYHRRYPSGGTYSNLIGSTDTDITGYDLTIDWDNDVNKVVIIGESIDQITSDSQIYISKVDYRGDPEWSYEYGEIESHEKGDCIKTDGNGNYLVSGTVDNKATLMKLNSSGNMVWQQNYLENINFDEVQVKSMVNGGFLLAATKMPSNNAVDGYSYIIRVDENGDYISSLFLDNMSITTLRGGHLASIVGGYSKYDNYSWTTRAAVLKINEYEGAKISGYVNLDGGSGDIIDVAINIGDLPSIYPDENGYFETVVTEEDYGYYTVKYSLDTYYPEYSEQIFIDGSEEINLPAETLNYITSWPNVYVSNDPEVNAFGTIQEAIDACLNGNSVFVLPGIYYENINFNGKAVTVEGMGGLDNCIIDGSYPADPDFGSVVTFENNESSNSILKKFTIQNGNGNYADPDGDGEFHYYGGGIYCFSAQPVMENLIVKDNSSTYAGGVYCEENSYPKLSSSKVSNNNATRDGGGIYCANIACIELLDVLIQNNYAGDDGAGLYFITCSNPPGYGNPAIVNSIITNNVITGTAYGDDHKGCGIYCRDSIIEIINSTIMYNTGIDYCGGIVFKGSSNVTIKNSIIWENQSPQIYSPEGEENSYMEISYSDILGGDGELDIDNNDWVEFLHGNVYTEPHLNSSYQPIWNTTTKSPCIDTGDPNLDGDDDFWYDDRNDCDPDGSRPDMGAIPAEIHKNDAWKLPYAFIDNNWKWISFPSVDITTGNNTMGSMMEQLTSEYLLDEVRWKVEGNLMQFFWDYNHWTNPDHVVTSPQGYKLHMKDDVYEGYVLEVSGFQEPKNTVIELLGNETKNWIGYFLDNSLKAEKAFAGVWDNLTSIKTQYWSMMRIPGTDNWITGDDTVLEYGDMVVVTCFENCDLIWNDDSNPDDPGNTKNAENFDYTEEADYIPVFVELGPDDEATEIGVLIDGVCKGAAVVEADTVQIRSYMIGDEGDLEFVLYNGDRAALQTYKEYSIYNPITQMNENGAINASANNDFYFVSFDEETEDESPPFLSIYNYPNPFNPQTTIFYSLPQDSKVNLSIYNIKGQKVRELVNGYNESGKYQTVWNGEDEKNNTVSSGIYFYRIETGKGSLNRKMILMK